MTKKDGILKEIQDLEFDKSVLSLVSDSTRIQGCVVNANASSSQPYLPSKKPMSIKYWKLEPSERTKINEQTEKIFQNIRPGTPKLNPKNPRDIYNIRVWLSIRDCVTFEYYAENKGTSKKHTPSYTEAYHLRIDRYYKTHQNYINALQHVEPIMTVKFPEDTDVGNVFSRNYIDYLSTALDALTFLNPATMAAGKISILVGQIRKDILDEKAETERTKELANLTMSFAKLKVKAMALHNTISQKLHRSLQDGTFEDDYNKMSDTQKLDYVLREFEPIKPDFEFAAEIYFDYINLRRGWIEIDLTTVIDPKARVIKLISRDKVKVVVSPRAENVAKGLNLIRKELPKFKGVDWDLGNLFEWPVNKKINIKYKDAPYTNIPLKGPYTMNIIKGSQEDRDKMTVNTNNNLSVPMEYNAKIIWGSMMKPGFEIQGDPVYLKDYIYPYFRIDQFKDIVY
jgi:hypothetical protein